DFYKYIEKADILKRLKELLGSDDCTLRAKACSVVGNMCRHSSYFYDLLVGNAAYHNDSLYEELRRSIAKLTDLLLSNEKDIIRVNAAGALSNLVRHNNKLCDDVM
uniref:non-specific serine/threonine protein kinase n=1 Tax=Chenopodium quinoa TaxID=63459 RepID=A0A803LA52_CHEQI